MKKILVINTKYKIFGGEDSNIIEELSFLKKHYEVEYLQFDNSNKLTVYEAIAFFTCNNFKSNKLIEKKVNEFNPDIAYVHNTWFSANLGIFRVLEKLNVPVVLKIHNFRFNCTKYFSLKKHLDENKMCPGCGIKRKRFSFFNKYFENSYLKSFFVIIYGKKYLKVLKGKKIKIVVLNSFYKKIFEKITENVENLFVAHNPIKVTDDFRYNPESDYVVYAGSISEEKGINELSNLWKKLNLDLRLVLIGPGEFIKDKNVSNILFTGPLENKETLNYIKNSRAVITATKMYEGQPRLLSEASSYGVPSIYPSFGGMDEYFPSNYNLSFDQFDYEDLAKKISILQDKEILIEESKKINENINKYFSEHNYFENFRSIILN